MNIQKARQQLILLWEGALARGSPESTPCYLSIWALSAPPPQDPQWPAGLTSVPTLPLQLGPRYANVQEYLPAGPSVWGRESRCGLAGAGVPGAASPLRRQWEPALIGKTQQDRGWLHSQEEQGKLSQHFLFIYFFQTDMWRHWSKIAIITDEEELMRTLLLNERNKLKYIFRHDGDGITIEMNKSEQYFVHGTRFTDVFDLCGKIKCSGLEGG